MRLLHGIRGAHAPMLSEQDAEERMRHMESDNLRRQMHGIEHGMDAILGEEEENHEGGSSGGEGDSDAESDDNDHFDHVLDLFDLEHPDFCRRTRQRAVTHLALCCGCVTQAEVDRIGQEDEYDEEEGGEDEDKPSAGAEESGGGYCGGCCRGGQGGPGSGGSTGASPKMSPATRGNRATATVTPMAALKHGGLNSDQHQK